MAKKTNISKTLRAHFAGEVEKKDLLAGVDPVCLEVLSFIQKAYGFTNPVLRGSALYLPVIHALRGTNAAGTRPGDYDILVNFGDFEEFHRNQARYQCSSGPAQNLMHYMNSRRGMSGVDYKFARAPDADGHVFIEITGIYKGKNIDLMVQNAPLDPACEARGTDAPITGLAMNAGGEVFAHPDFFSHASALIYRPSLSVHPTHVRGLYEKMEGRFPGLRLERWSDLAPERPAPRFQHPCWTPI